MTMTFTKRSVKWLWTAGTIVVFGMILLLWWHGYNAQTFAQASFFSTRLDSFRPSEFSGRSAAAY